MRENVDEILESVVKRAVKSSGLESPSIDFTNLVMAHVNAKSSTTVYQPLISRTGWIVILASVTAFVVYLYLTSGAEANDWYKMIDFSVVSNNGFSNFFYELEFAQVTFYAMLVFGLMLCAQIPILKYFIDKRHHGLS